MKTTATASNKAFLGDLTSDERLFVNRILELIRQCEEKYCPQFTHFLDLRQQHLAQAILDSEKIDNYRFFGGYDNAERTILGIFPDYIEPADSEFPVKAITFTYRAEDKLSHRDFLGAIMALDIRRDAVGDIAVGVGKAVIFTEEIASKAILSELSKVGRVGVKQSEGFDLSKMPKQGFKEIDAVVASLRADCIVSAISKLSRDKTCDLIKRIGISVDGRTVFSPSFIMSEGQIFSVRGYGKFKFVNICGFTRKNRVTIKLLRFD